jgi:hypothetical protein
MVAQVKPSKKNSPAVKDGNLKQAIPAEVYKETNEGGDKLPAEAKESGKDYMNRMNIATGTVSKGNYKATKTDGVKQRGYGAATKGFTSRGPLG